MKAFKPLGAVVVLAILLATATAVIAAPPVFSTFDGQGTDEYDCGDFSIVDEWTVHVRYRDFYDNQGNYIRTAASVAFTDHWRNPDSGEEINASTQHMQQEWDAAGASLHGLAYHVVVPGVGNVLIDAGYIYETTGNPPVRTFHGNHQFYEQGDLSALCAVLQ